MPGHNGTRQSREHVTLSKLPLQVLSYRAVTLLDESLHDISPLRRVQHHRRCSVKCRVFQWVVAVLSAGRQCHRGLVSWATLGSSARPLKLSQSSMPQEEG